MALFPNVPPFPGVPQLLRPFGYQAPSEPSIALPDLGIQSFGASDNGPPPWGIFDSDGNAVLVPDSILEFYHRQESRVSSFPVQEGSFASYNKVATPFEISVRLSKGGTQDDREAFLTAIDTISGTVDLYTILTPEKRYPDCNVTRYEVSRRGPQGAYFLTEVDLFFIQVLQVKAQYTQTGADTQNAKNQEAQPPVNQGSVQTSVPDAAQVAAISDAVSQGAISSPVISQAIAAGVSGAQLQPVVASVASVVPTASVASQTMSAVLGSQAVKLALYSKAGAMYADIALGNTPIVTTKRCAAAVGLLTGASYRGLNGDFAVLDTSGKYQEPIFAGLGHQFFMAYLNGQ